MICVYFYDICLQLSMCVHVSGFVFVVFMTRYHNYWTMRDIDLSFRFFFLLQIAVLDFVDASWTNNN